MPQLVLFVLAVAACISLVYGRRAGQEFVGWVLNLVGMLILFVLVVGIGIYVSERREAAKVEDAVKAAERARALAPAPLAATPPSAVPAYERTAHPCSSCAGAGLVTCSSCGGTGYRPGSQNQSPPVAPDCARCGMGVVSGGGVGRTACSPCNGTGQVWY